MSFLRLKHILHRHSSSPSEPPPDRVPSQEAVREYGIYADAPEELATLALQFCENATHFTPKLLSYDTTLTIKREGCNTWGLVEPLCQPVLKWNQFIGTVEEGFDISDGDPKTKGADGEVSRYGEENVIEVEYFNKMRGCVYPE